MEKKGIWYLPLKGIILKDCYPMPAMREMTDNDILCDAEKMAEIKLIMESMGYDCNQFGRTNHDVYQKDVLVFEMHSALFNSIDFPLIFEYFRTVKNRLVKDADNSFGYHMKAEDFYIYIICHIYKHYAKAGTGLRSLLDIFVFNNKNGQMLDREYISRELDRIGINEYEKRSRLLAEKLFSFQPLSESDKKELRYYIDSNCYGNKENMASFRLNNDDSKKAKRRYYFKRIFPDEVYLKNIYPMVYRHKILYPFLVVYRPFKGVVTKRKQLYSEYKSIKIFKKKQ